MSFAYSKTIKFIDASFRYPHDTDETSYVEKNSFNDYGVVLESVTIGEASPKLILTDVPFRDGQVDSSDFYGDVRFDNRKIDMNFLIPWQSVDQRGIYSTISSDLNGKNMKIVLASDEEWYYEGRLSVGSLSISNGFMAFSISMDAFPYKMQDLKKTFSTTANASVKTVAISYTDRMPSVISAKSTTNAINFTFTDSNKQTITKQLTSSQLKKEVSFGEFVLTKGSNNALKFSTAASPTGSGTLNIYYRRGML